jgi:tetratricopeptide (TPR) repeat protein
MPSIGACLGIGWIAASFLRGAKPTVKTLAFITGGILLCLLSWKQVTWIPVWRSEESIARAIVAAAPKNALGYNNLGHALATQGRLNEAEQVYRVAIRLKPYYPEAHNNLGLVLADWGKMGEVTCPHSMYHPECYSCCFNYLGV